MQLTVLSPKATKLKSMTLPKELFEAKVNQNLMAQAVRVYLANKRQGTVHAKSRGQVKGSGKKIYRQKGTGRARHGDKQAPIFVGGGKAHGPKSISNYTLKLTKKMKQAALKSALSFQAQEKNIILVDKLESLKPKTSIMNQALEKILKKSKSGSDGPFKKLTLVIPESIESIIRSTRNIPNVTLLPARKLSTYQVLNAGTLVIHASAIKVLKDTFIKSKSKSKS